MCVQETTPQRVQTLWWVLVSYFRAYPPLVQGHGGTRPGSQAHGRPVKQAAPRIRIYW